MLLLRYVPSPSPPRRREGGEVELIIGNMKKFHLGEFEEVVMLTVGILYKDAYGVSIKKEIENRLSRNVSVGALQTALKRLEQKGYLKSRDGESTQERAGRPKRYFMITAYGKKAMEYAKSTRNELWDAIPRVVLESVSSHRLQGARDWKW